MYASIHELLHSGCVVRVAGCAGAGLSAGEYVWAGGSAEKVVLLVRHCVLVELN